MRIPPSVLADLKALGAAADVQSPETERLLARLQPFEPVNHLGWDTWDILLKDIPESELARLLRGLVTAEKFHQWSVIKVTYQSRISFSVRLRVISPTGPQRSSKISSAPRKESLRRIECRDHRVDQIDLLHFC
jgi:hypothetical protein